MNNPSYVLLLLLGAAMLSSCGKRVGEARPDLLTPLRAEFAAADKDGDDTLTREEAAAMPELVPVFDAVDTDHNDRVSTGELRSYLEWQRVLRTPRGRFPETRP
ncbi:MAG: hypothetical protein M3O62_01265 [Pseudomonadota bacterium]|nr:hypothetical protein [Pseudomonadota bacterium]